MALRPYQYDVKTACYNAWSTGARVVMPVVPTGGGKTVVIGEIAREYDHHGIAIAHRQELVGQISVALAREGIRHDLIVPDAVRRTIIKAHIEDVGRDFTSPNAKWRVAGVDTLVKAKHTPWANQIGLVIQDEGHHVLKENKWGKAFEMFPNARGMFPTATPTRADGRGLGIDADGLVDELVIGPGMRDLIDMGYLTDYRIFAPKPADLDMSRVDISPTTGDYNQDQMRKAVKGSRKLVGDVVKHYLAHANGKLGVTFAADVEEASKIAGEFRAAGVPAEVVSAKTPDDLRRSILRKFKNREILQLVNVDLFGEGFDLPAIEVVSMARPTQSYSLYCQQFGRALRLMLEKSLSGVWDTFTDDQRRYHISQSSKPKAIIIDHVGNVLVHGLPDKPRKWTLDSRERRSKGGAADAIPLRACPGCTVPYERIELVCPHCGTPAPEPADRSGPKFVDGDLPELSAEVLAVMRGAVAKVDGMAYPPKSLAPHAKKAMIHNHLERQRAQARLRGAIALWAGAHSQREDRVNYKRFYLTFGVDVVTAQALGETEADTLAAQIVAKLQTDGYDTSSHYPTGQQA